MFSASARAGVRAALRLGRIARRFARRFGQCLHAVDEISVAQVDLLAQRVAPQLSAMRIRGRTLRFVTLRFACDQTAELKRNRLPPACLACNKASSARRMASPQSC